MIEPRDPTKRRWDMGKEIMLKHMSLDHKFVILDNDGIHFDNCYTDDDGNLHLHVEFDG